MKKQTIISIIVLILVVILAIGVSLYLNRQPQGEQPENNPQTSEYNKPFEKYAGTVTGAQAKELCELVKEHNEANSEDATKNIAVQRASAEGIIAPPASPVSPITVNSIKSSINEDKQYTVDFGYNKTTGNIVVVGIVDK